MVSFSSLRIRDWRSWVPMFGAHVSARTHRSRGARMEAWHGFPNHRITRRHRLQAIACVKRLGNAAVGAFPTKNAISAVVRGSGSGRLHAYATMRAVPYPSRCCGLIPRRTRFEECDFATWRMVNAKTQYQPISAAAAASHGALRETRRSRCRCLLRESMNTCRGRFGRPPLILAPYPQPTHYLVRATSYSSKGRGGTKA